MDTQLRHLLIQKLTDAVTVMGPGAIFERFGVLLVSHLLDTEIHHRGASISGNPVGGALDGLSPDGKIAVETSVRQTYFSGDLRKPRDDLAHVLSLAPQVEQIYLLASRRAPTGVIERFVEQENRGNALSERSLRVFDGRAIAEAIVDVLLSRDHAVDELSALLPALAGIRDEHAATLSLPVLESNHISRPQVLADLASLHSNARCVVISGMGGIGKSEIATAYVAAHRSAFQYTLWLDARAMSGVELLAAVPLRRGGAEHNLLGLLGKHRCLLILDDAPASLTVEAIEAACSAGSRVLITRRQRSDGAYELPMLDADAALSILGHALPEGVPSKAFESIWNAVGGHPLSLRLLNSSARGGTSWEDVVLDCEHIGRADDGNTLLAERILGRHRAVLRDELSVFAWAGQSSCDREFLKSLVGPVGVRKLISYGLTVSEDWTSVRLHDIVEAAIKAGDWLSDRRARELDDRFERYIVSLMRSDDHNLDSMAVQLRGFLERKVEGGDRRTAVIYALISAWSASQVKPDALPDPYELARSLAGQRGRDVDAEIALTVEIVEALHRNERHYQGMESARQKLRGRLGVFDTLLSIKDLTDRQTAEIIHHHGKARRILLERDHAIELFERSLKVFPLNEAKLQLLRLYTKDRARAHEAEAIALDIVRLAKGGKDVTSSVLLGLGETLNSAHAQWAEKLLLSEEDFFLDRALRGAFANVAQAYEVLAAFARQKAWKDPASLPDFLSKLPELSAVMLDDDRACGAYAEIMYHAATKVSVEDYSVRALQAFETLRSPDPFQSRRWGETLLAVGRHEEAETLLAGIVDDDGRIWVAHSLSRAKFGLGKLDEAKLLVDEALAGTTGRNKQYRASFLLQRIKVRLAIGETPADDFVEAVGLADNQSVLEQLETLRSDCEA
jgi:tetratricopeptide (TPR) repeat protein